MNRPKAGYNWEAHYDREHSRSAADFRIGFMDRIAMIEYDRTKIGDWEDGWYRADGDIVQVEMGVFG